MPRTIIDVHILQTVPPSNLNRDDTGSPKTAFYGGTRRARVSSQAWKRATRRDFERVLDPSQLGVRTKRLVELVGEEVSHLAPDLHERSHELAGNVVKETGLVLKAPRVQKDDEPGPDQSEYLVFLSRHQVTRLAELAIAAERAGTAVTKQTAKLAADTGHSVDVALFGRMVADAADLNVDACAQVAHAISVHGVDNEYDYFTAVDDRAPEDNPGAGMIGTVEFNSSTLYRYATVDGDALIKALGDRSATRRAVEAFVRSFVTSMPTGKQNTFANRTLPDSVVACVRDSQPVNLVGAFEEAILTNGSSRLHEASRRLADHSRSTDAAFGTTPVSTLVVQVGEATEVLGELGERVSLDQMVHRLGQLVDERLPETA